MSRVIEGANALDLSSMSEICLPDKTSSLYVHGSTKYRIALESSKTINPADLNDCFRLIESTSASQYTQSSLGWKPKHKAKEMVLPDMRYLLVRRAGSDLTDGFLSFMLTYEDGHEVIYCYELHLDSSSRGCGLGTHLMGIMESVGRKVGVEKSMLTVFLENAAAVRFYERLGYGLDEFSPQPRRVRNRVINPDYVILSKALRSKGSDALEPAASNG
ncbi:MAG: hypothetical protein MMC33_007872 [Icmadophila ericetorum]|nr:hypothetical protein [Icmadophila ericetorum]